MRKLSKLFALISVIAILILSISCSTSNSSNPNNSSDNDDSNDAPKNTLLYWDSTSNSFKGSVSWTPSTLEDKVLLGFEGDGVWGEDFIDRTQWQVKLPQGVSSMIVPVKRSSYTISHSGDTGTIHMSVEISGSDSDWVKWSDVPGLEVQAIICFNTGVNYLIGKQNGYGGYDGYVSALGQDVITDPEGYLFRINNNGYNTSELCYCLWYGSYGRDDRVKIKSATVYSYEDSEMTNLIGTYTAENNWNDLSWLGSYSNASSNHYTDFTPTLNKNDVNHLKAVVTLLNGKQITAIWHK